MPLELSRFGMAELNKYLEELEENLKKTPIYTMANYVSRSSSSNSSTVTAFFNKCHVEATTKKELKVKEQSVTLAMMYNKAVHVFTFYTSAFSKFYIVF